MQPARRDTAPNDADSATPGADSAHIGADPVGLAGPDLAAWIGREESAEARLEPQLARMLGATLRADWTAQSGFEGGEVLPPLWHWAAFPPTAPMAALGMDGHPKTGGFLPDVGLQRRMWAGGALEFLRPLHVGEKLSRLSRIAGVKEKTGGAGRMVFVTVEHDLSGADGLAVRERQDIVYLNIPERFAPPAPIAAPDRIDHLETVEVGPVRLFRYSACTFNGHRIHYDLPYATEVEKYPGLVVHGPLQASLLIEAATRWRGAAPDRFEFRGVRPMFHFNDLALIGVGAGDGALELCTAEIPRGGGAPGAQGMKARAEWSEASMTNNSKGGSA